MFCTCSIVILLHSHDHLPPQSDPVENNGIFTAELWSRSSRAQTPVLRPLDSVNGSVTIKSLSSHEVQYGALCLRKNVLWFHERERLHQKRLCCLRKGMCDLAYRVSLPVHSVLVWRSVIYLFRHFFCLITR